MTQQVAHEDLHRIVVTCTVYDDRRRFLCLHRRADLKVYPNLWSIIGGGLEASDYRSRPSPDNSWNNVLEVVLRREVREEAAIEIGEIEFLNDFVFIRPDNIPVLGLRYGARAITADVRYDPKDSQAFAWLKVSQLNKYNFIRHIPDEIRRYDKVLKARGIGA